MPTKKKTPERYVDIQGVAVAVAVLLGFAVCRQMNGWKENMCMKVMSKMGE